jgi:adenylate cyclase
MRSVDSVFDWLLDGVAGAKTPMDVLERMCPDLAAAGVPIERAEAFVRTLHPHIAGRSFTWRAGQANVEVTNRTYAYLQSDAIQKSALMPVFQHGEHVRRRLEGATDDPALADLTADGFTDFYAAPLTFLGGAHHGITFATKRAGGFRDDDVAALRRVVRPLARVAEILALSRTATNLLNTYVGHDAGERILAGHIQRGDTSLIHAVIWFSDLRGFTSMSSALPPVEIIRVLNDVFDCQVPAIEQHGGQVLKFMGDGLLAIFPVSAHDADDVGARCRAALDAARAAFASLDALNTRRRASGDGDVKFGVGLHLGEFAYGNIGGSGRLDFTCIGPAVNLASRLESLTGKLGRPIIASAEVAHHVGDASFESAGEHELKGVPGKVQVFAPRP